MHLIRQDTYCLSLILFDLYFLIDVLFMHQYIRRSFFLLSHTFTHIEILIQPQRLIDHTYQVIGINHTLFDLAIVRCQVFLENIRKCK